MLITVALLPIAAALVMMCKYKVSPAKALPAAWLLAVVFAMTFWKQPAAVITAASLQGIFKSLDIIFIISGAVLLLNVMRKSGALEAIKRTFSGISNDRRIQVIVISWLFSGFIEGASGFGAAPALAAPLLAGLGFPPLIAVGCSLICNTLPVPFGAVGIPVQTSVSAISYQLAEQGFDQTAFAQEVMDKLTLISGISGIFLPILAISFMIILSGGKRKVHSILEILPLAVLSGAVYIIPWRYAALYLGPELPSMLGALAGLPVILLCVKTGFLIPRHIWDFPEIEKSLPQVPCQPQTVQIPLFQAWLPYFALASLLLILRIPVLGFTELSAKSAIVLPELFHVPGSGATWKILNNPGLIPIALIAVISAICWKIPLREQRLLLKESLRQLTPAAVAIAISVAMVQIMIFTDNNCAGIPGMLNCIADGAVNVMGKAFLAISPLIGIFGTFFAGSCTVSNILFAPMQFNTAMQLGLSPELITALQNIGGGLGSMIRVSGVIAACATVNATGKEGKLIVLNSVPVLIMAILTVIAAVIVG